VLQSETRTIARMISDALRLFLRLGAGVLLALVLIGTLACAGVYAAVEAVPYPGSATTATALYYSAWPDLSVSRSETYVTREPFDRVSTWYSKAQGLGMVDQSGVGACIRMTRARVMLLTLEQNLSVRACATRTDSRVYLTRTVLVRLPRWVRTPMGALLNVLAWFRPASGAPPT
jgi:hypothetical protein